MNPFFSHILDKTELIEHPRGRSNDILSGCHGEQVAGIGVVSDTAHFAQIHLVANRNCDQADSGVAGVFSFLSKQFFKKSIIILLLLTKFLSNNELLNNRICINHRKHYED